MHLHFIDTVKPNVDLNRINTKVLSLHFIKYLQCVIPAQLVVDKFKQFTIKIAFLTQICVRSKDNIFK